jgi:hypothetical protein
MSDPVVVVVDHHHPPDIEVEYVTADSAEPTLAHVELPSDSEHDLDGQGSGIRPKNYRTYTKGYKLCILKVGLRSSPFLFFLFFVSIPVVAVLFP